MDIAISVFLLILSIILWRIWYVRKFAKQNHCIVCGKRNVGHHNAFCSKECSDTVRNTNWQQLIGRHVAREVDHIRNKYIRQYGRWGRFIPIAINDGPPHLTYNEWMGCLRYWNFQCCYCSIQLSSASAQLEHAAPISSGAMTVKPNVLPSCGICNSQKSAKSLYQFFADKPVSQRNQAKIRAYLREPYWLELKR